VLARLLRQIRPRKTMVVVRLHRLARPVSHLLTVIEAFKPSAAHLRCLGDLNLYKTSLAGCGN
jgi:DNA invertase Pin-like site-specific DNA recombinase